MRLSTNNNNHNILRGDVADDDHHHEFSSPPASPSPPQHNHQQNLLSSSSSPKSIPREMLYPLERFVVIVLTFIGKICVKAALFLFEMAITRWSSANKKIRQRRNPLNNNKNTNSSNNNEQPTQNNNPCAKQMNTTATATTKNENEDNNKSSTSNLTNIKTSKKPSVDEKNSICMANMLAVGVLPYYLASECTNAMMKPPSETNSSSSSSSSRERELVGADENCTASSSSSRRSPSSSCNNNNNNNNYSLISRVMCDDGSAKFRILFSPTDPKNIMMMNMKNRHHQSPPKIDGILLVVGSSSQSDDVDNNCNAPVLGGIASQLVENCRAVGSLAIVSARVDFLSKPESLSSALDRFETLCSAVCAAFPTARGPLIILARHVTATLVLHSVVRAASKDDDDDDEGSSPSSSSDNDDDDDQTSPNTSGKPFFPASFLQTPMTTSSGNNSSDNLQGLFPAPAASTPTLNHNKNPIKLGGKKPPSLKKASVIIFSPFVGWNIIEEMKKSSSKNNNSKDSPEKKQEEEEDRNKVMGTPHTSAGFDEDGNYISNEVTPQQSPNGKRNSLSKHQNNNNNPLFNCNQEDSQNDLMFGMNQNPDYSYDEEMFERFEEAGSYLTGCGGSSASANYFGLPRSPSNNNNNNNRNVSSSSGEEENDDGGENQDGGFRRIFRPSFYYRKIRVSSSQIASNIAQTVDFVVKNATRPEKWKLSRLFKWRIRSVFAQLWTRMQEEVAPLIFSPLLIDWFPATSITFLHPTIRAFIVCDSAAPYSVETLHWARGLVSQGCNVRLIEWSSQASRDPYSEFQARIVDNEATAWIRDMLIEEQQQQQQQQQIHHHNQSQQEQQQQMFQNVMMMMKMQQQQQNQNHHHPPIWETNNFSYTLADGTTNHNNTSNTKKEDFTIIEGVRSEVQSVQQQQQEQEQQQLQSNNSSFAVASQHTLLYNHQHQQTSSRGASLGGISLPTPSNARNVTAPPLQPTTAPTMNQPMFPSRPSAVSANNNNPHHQVRVLYQHQQQNYNNDTNHLLNPISNNNDDDESSHDNNNHQKQSSSGLLPLQRENTLLPNDDDNSKTHQIVSSASEDDGGEVVDEEITSRKLKMKKKQQSMKRSGSGSSVSPSPNQPPVAAAAVAPSSSTTTSKSRKEDEEESTSSPQHQQQQQQPSKLKHVDSLDRWSMHGSEFAF